MPPKIVTLAGKQYSFPEGTQDDEVVAYLYKTRPQDFNEPDPEKAQAFINSAKARRAQRIQPRGPISTLGNIPEAVVQTGITYAAGAYGAANKQAGELLKGTEIFGDLTELRRRKALVQSLKDAPTDLFSPGTQAIMPKAIAEAQQRVDEVMKTIEEKKASPGPIAKFGQEMATFGEQTLDAISRPEEIGLSWLGTPMGVTAQGWEDVRISKAPQVAQAVARGAASIIPILAANTMVPGGGIMMAENMLYHEQYGESIAAGYTPEQAHNHATNYTLGATALEYLGALGATRWLRYGAGGKMLDRLKAGKKLDLPAMRALGVVANGTTKGESKYLRSFIDVLEKNRLGRAAEGGFIEGFTEFSQAAWSSMVTDGPTTKDFDGWLFEGFIGGLSGGLISSFGNPHKELNKAVQSGKTATETLDAIRKVDPNLAEHIKKKGLWGILQKVRSGEIQTAEDFVKAVGYTMEPLSSTGELTTDLKESSEEGRRAEFATLEKDLAVIFEWTKEEGTESNYTHLLSGTQKLPTFYNNIKNAILYGNFNGFTQKESHALRMYAAQRQDLVDHLYKMEHREGRALPGDQRIILEETMLAHDMTPREQMPAIVRMYEDVLWNISQLLQKEDGTPYTSVAEFVKSPHGAPVFQAITEAEAETVGQKHGVAVGMIPRGFWDGDVLNHIAMTLGYANTSTPFHETSHYWIERLKRMVADDSQVGRSLIALINETAGPGIKKIKSLQDIDEKHSEVFAQLSEIYLFGRSPEGLSDTAAEGLSVLREGMRGMYEFDKQRRVKMSHLRQKLDPEMAVGIGPDAVDGLQGIFDYMFFGKHSSAFTASLTSVQQAFVSLHQMNPKPLVTSADPNASMDSFVMLEEPKKVDQSVRTKLREWIKKFRPMISFIDHSLWDLYDIEMMLIRDTSHITDPKAAKGARTKALNDLSKRLKKLDPKGKILNSLPYEGAKNSKARNKLRGEMEERLRLLQEKMRIVTWDALTAAMNATPEDHQGPVEVRIGQIEGETGLQFQLAEFYSKVHDVVDAGSMEDRVRRMSEENRQKFGAFMELRDKWRELNAAGEDSRVASEAAIPILKSIGYKFRLPIPVFDVLTVFPNDARYIAGMFLHANEPQFQLSSKYTQVPTIIDKSPDEHFAEMPQALQKMVRQMIDIKKQLVGVLNAGEPPTDLLAQAAEIMQAANVKFVDPTPLFDAQKLLQLPNEQIMYRFYYANKKEWTDVPQFQLTEIRAKQDGTLIIETSGLRGPNGGGLFDTFALERERDEAQKGPEFQLSPKDLRRALPKTAVVDTYGGKHIGHWGSGQVGTSQTFYPEETVDNRGRWEPRGDIKAGTPLGVYHATIGWTEGEYNMAKVNQGTGAGGDNIGAFFHESRDEATHYTEMLHKEHVADPSKLNVGELEQEIRDKIQFGALSDFTITPIPRAPSSILFDEIWQSRDGNQYYVGMTNVQYQDMTRMSEAGEVQVALIPVVNAPSNFRSPIFGRSDNELTEALEEYFYDSNQVAIESGLLSVAKTPVAYDALLKSSVDYGSNELEFMSTGGSYGYIKDEQGSFNLGRRYLDQSDFNSVETVDSNDTIYGLSRVITPAFVVHFKEPIKIGGAYYYGIIGNSSSMSRVNITLEKMRRLRNVHLTFNNLMKASGLPDHSKPTPTNIHILYLDIHRPFDLNLGVKGSMGWENVSEEEAKAKIRQAIEENGGVSGRYVQSDPDVHGLEAVIESVYDPTSKYPYHTSDKHLRGILNNTVDGQAVMKELGFDGATHMGRNQNRKWIAFDKEQILHKFLVHKGIDEHGLGRFDHMSFQLAKKKAPVPRAKGTSLQRKTLEKYGIIRDDYTPEGDPRDHIELNALMEAAELEMSHLEHDEAHRNKVTAEVAKSLFSDPSQRLAFVMFHLKRWGRLSQMAAQGSQHAVRALADIEQNIKPLLSEMGTQAGRDLYVHKVALQFAELPFVVNELLQTAKKMGFDPTALVEFSNFADLNKIKGIKANSLKEFEQKLKELLEKGDTDLSNPRNMKERMIQRAMEKVTSESKAKEPNVEEINAAVTKALFYFNQNNIISDLVTTIAYNNMLMTLGRGVDAISSLGMVLWKMTGEPLAEGTWELLRTIPRGFKARDRYMIESWTAPSKGAWTAATRVAADLMTGATSWVAYQRRWEVNLGRSTAFAHDLAMEGKGAGKAVGYALDALPRFMTAMDAFFRIMAEDVVRQQYTKRRAQWEAEDILEEKLRDLSAEVNSKRPTDKRLSPEKLDEKLAEPGGATEFIETYISMMGAQTTFQTEAGGVVRWVMQSRDKLDQMWMQSPAGKALPIPIVRLFAVPFVPTIANLTKFAMEFTPVGIGVGTGSGTLLALGGLGPAASALSRSTFREFMGKQFVAHILMMLLGDMFDRGWLTGPEENQQEREFNAQRRITPYSIRLSVPWEDEPVYIPIPAPLSFSLIPIAARMKAIKTLPALDPESEEAEKVRAELRRSIMNDVLDNTFFNNMLRILDDTRRLSLAKPTARFIENLIPSSGLLKQANQLYTQSKFGYTPWTKKTEMGVGEILYTDLAAPWWNGYDTYPWNDEPIPTVVDYFGRKVGTSQLLRLPLPSSMVPVRPSDNFSPAETEFARLGFYPAGPAATIEGVDLTKEQHSSYYLHFGIVGMKVLERLVESPQYQSLSALTDGKERQVFLLDKALVEAKKVARREVLRRYPELTRQVIRRRATAPWARE